MRPDPDRTFTQAEVSDLVARRVARERLKWERTLDELVGTSRTPAQLRRAAREGHCPVCGRPDDDD
jgi:hypothetical protein